ncbi:ATP-binding protein [Salisaeta longa]|uniref:ATP-binding protein n=1 Tax=Salisaeta longa TaxID=503170 RepID=UPI0003B5D6CA|nr:transporter substrate-binding domain-containing protein [Salisaeta longa]
MALALGLAALCVPRAGARAIPRSVAATDTLVDLTARERAWIARHPVIRYAPIPDYAPIESYGPSGQPVGLAPDYLAVAIKRLGMRLHIVRAPTWRAVLDSLRNGRADLSAAIQKTTARSRYLRFTEPYLTVPTVLLVRAQAEAPLSLERLDGHTVAVVDRYAVASYLENRYPKVHYRKVPDIQTGLEKAAFGLVDGMVLSLPVAGAAIEAAQLPNLRVASRTGYRYALRFGVPRDQAMLQHVLNKALASITAQTHARIYQRWMALDAEALSPSPAPPTRLLLLVVVGLLVLLGAGAAWTWTLRREVTRRTHDLRQAKEEAEDMNRLKSAVLANMSHEFRTPLTSIIGFSEALRDESPDATTDRFLRHINENGRRLLHTLESLLHLSQLEAGAVALRPQRVALADALHEAADPFREQARDANLTLRIEPPPAPVQAYADPAALHLVLTHLLSNALKFTEPGGRITARTTPDPPDALLTIADTGVGIDEAFIPKLYDAFRQESSGDSRSFEGTGLGLAVTRKLVNMMDGSIAVASRKGEGTQVSVRLPLYAVDHPPAMTPGTREEASNGVNA